ncbi:MAG: arginine--tRNA ligase, partial [bacterium]|nr:arginine--tRNA ligase [bacterium]
MRETLTEILAHALESAREDGTLPVDEIPAIQLEATRDQSFGDYATNLAMVLAGPLKRSPREIAAALVDHLDDNDGVINRCEIAGPGFINFFLQAGYWARVLEDIESKKERYGRSDLGKGKEILVEFVSANPTGPLHIGHGRGAVVGDALARILEAAGFSVFREFYVNDAGRQLRTLGRSVWIRYRQLAGEAIDFPTEDAYPGDYVVEIARGVLEQEPERYLTMKEEEAVPVLAAVAAQEMLEGIRSDLKRINVRFDRFFSEKSLYAEGKVEACLSVLEKKDLLFREANGALLLKTSEMDDDKDRVLVKGDGDYTYFASDIAYHRDKLERGAARLVDIWGADHHGYVARIKSAVRALGYDETMLQVLLIQMVNLLREGKPVRMGKRSGEFVTLAEVIDEVGTDVVRFFFLLRRADSHLDFDLDLAKTESNENPVYYVQYAHARICSIFRQARERGIETPAFNHIVMDQLSLPEELELMKFLGSYPEVVEGAAQAMEPHRICFYVQELAGRLHGYYFKHRIVSDDPDRTRARLFLVGAIRQVIANALGLLGVSAPR